MLRYTITLAILASLCLASCPFRRQSERAKDPADIWIQRSLQEASKGAFCGPPLCEATKTGRRLLSGAKVGTNGFPTLEQTTVNAIEASFCTVVDTTIDNDRNACSISGGLSGGGENANEARSDIVAGAIQLAFHDAGTYDPTNTEEPGGADGCACDKFGPNAGLDYIKNVLDPVYQASYKDYLSLADFWVICSNAAIKSSVAAVDAPLSVGFKYGRSDVDCTVCSVDIASRLPDESKSTDHVEDVFVTRMGFTKAETVALMGAHSMGKMEPLNTGYAGKWDRTFSQLDNVYFAQILDKPWFRFDVVETTEFDGKIPYPTYVSEATKHEWRVRAGGDAFQDDTDKLLNTDMCLAWAIGDDEDVNDETCSTRPCTATNDVCAATDRPDQCGTQDRSWRDAVVTYRDDNTKFLTDFAAAWQKLVELNPNSLVAVGTEQAGSTATTTAPASAPTAAPTGTPTAATTKVPTSATTNAPVSAPTRRTGRNKMVEQREDTWEESTK